MPNSINPIKDARISEIWDKVAEAEVVAIKLYEIMLADPNVNEMFKLRIGFIIADEKRHLRIAERHGDGYE